MRYRSFGRTGWRLSEISFGAWAIGGAWGNVDDKESMATLHAALDAGVNFFDTADVYGDGRSERLLAKLKNERKERFYIATKAGRRLPVQTTEGYNRKNLTAFVNRSLKNLNTNTIDLLQLHCPPTEVYYRPEVFGILDDLVKAGKLRHYGVSVERVEEAFKAIEFPRAVRADHLQHFPPTSCGTFFCRGAKAQGGNFGTGAAGVRFVVGEDVAPQQVCQR
jgi:aryl-alcohol dehydrogenase-like predicted oxidoreductase